MSGGGCSCNYCGAIFVGHEWQDGCCSYCDRDAAATAAPCGDMAVPKDQQPGAKQSPKHPPESHHDL